MKGLVQEIRIYSDIRRLIIHNWNATASYVSLLLEAEYSAICISRSQYSEIRMSLTRKQNFLKFDSSFLIVATG